MEWYQTYNNFGEIIFRRQWAEKEAHPMLAINCFWCPPGDRIEGNWVYYYHY